MLFKPKKSIITILLVMLVLLSLSFPKIAQAQFVVTDVPHLAMQGLKWVWEKSSDLLKTAWKHGGAIAYRNAINLYLGQIAKQTAEYVATGGKGQKPMFITDPDYWKKMGDSILGEYIDQTAKSFTGFTSKSLCDPIDPTIKFNMLVGMDPKYQKMMFNPDMRCSWSTIKKRYRNLSKKKLIDFSFNLGQGAAAHYRAELAGQIQGEASLAADIKETFLVFIKKLKGESENIEQSVNKLKENAGGTKNIPLSTLENIKEIINKGTSEIQKAKEKFQNSKLAKAGKCFTKSADDFCTNKDCLIICGDSYDEPTCKSNYSYCTATAGKTAKYFSLAIDYSNEIIDGAKDVLKYFADFEPTPLPSLEDLNKEFNPEGSDVAVMFKLQSDLFKKQSKAVEKSKFMQGLTGDINRLTTKISDITLTPGSLVSEEARQAVKGSEPASAMQYTGVAAADAIGVFTNTLATKLMKQMFTKGLNPDVSPNVIKNLKTDNVTSPTNEQKKVLYSSLAAAPIKRGNEITIYDEFAVCPGDKRYALPTNCLMDNGLVRAVEEGLTIEQAMNKTPTPLLNPNEIVGKPGDYDSILSWPNIKKLRRFRIFPLGLEIAAKKLFNRELGEDVEISLKKIVSEFNKNGDDGICGTNDNNESPFCHLVDPDWVLKASTYKCGYMGYSAVPMSGGANRKETCADLKDCIHEDESGHCDSWDYCTREKNIWKMNGDTCDKQYATCQTYQRDSDNKQFSYLSNTLSSDGCNPNNAGCKWYCSNWNENPGNLAKWACISPGHSQKFDHKETCTLSSNCLEDNGCLCNGNNGSCLVNKNEKECSYPVFKEYDDQGNTIFFNNKIKKCSAQNVGCHEYIRTAKGLGTNLVFNGSFEIDIINNITGEEESDGLPDSWSSCGIECKKDTLYSHSGETGIKPGYAWATPPLNSDPEVKQTNISILKNTFYTVSAWIKGKTGGKARISIGFLNNVPDPSKFSKYCTWYKGTESTLIDCYWPTFTKDTDYEKVSFTFNSGENTKISKITIQGMGNREVYFDDIKIETGEQATLYQDYGEANKIYLKNALKCQPKEVGCNLYIPTNADPVIPGIIKKQDKCYLDCLGYETFQQMPGYFNNGPPKLVNLIPSTAKTCSIPGCEEFTNLDTEGIEYYSYLRQCVKLNAQKQAIINNDGSPISPPDSKLCSYYYTWVGSEKGYQLKRYYLKKATMAYQGDPNANGPIKVSLNPDLELGSCQGKEDALTNPHCKQFYDANGDIYYRLYKNTITCSENCHAFRRTADQSVQMAIPSQGNVCNMANAGCREYKGPTAGNVYQVFWDDFENGAITPWIGGEFPPSGESVIFPGHSMNVDTYPYKVKRPVNGLIKNNKLYFLLFWVKGSGNYIPYFDNGTASVSDDLYFINQGSHQVSISNGDWHEVKVGPVNFNRVVATGENLVIQGPSGGFYIDNIILKQVQDDIYLIKDSWHTPCKCDTLANHENFSTGGEKCTTNNTADYSMVGCRTYQDRTGQFHYLKSFNSLCPELKVGCEALIDTQNSKQPFSQTFNSGGDKDDDIIIPADKLVYLINDSNNQCDKKNKGCERFGLPKLDINQNVISYTDVYLINDPDLYTNVPNICLKKGLGCEKYGESYFRDPGNKVCEYRESVVVGTGNITGWFKKGTDQACYYNADNSPYKPDGITYGIRANNESEYNGYVGICPKRQSGCTEFIDPLANNSHPDKGKYYYINNNKLDKSSCQYRVSLKKGCVLFNNTSLPLESLIYDSEQSYKASQQNNNLLTNAVQVSPGKGDSNIAIKVKRDRVCGEWLTCTGSREVWDKNAGNRYNICEFIGRCDKLIGSGQNNICGHYVPLVDPKPLTESEYKKRDVSWAGMDYSGYSIPDLYPVDLLFAKETEPGTGIYNLTYGEKGSNLGVDGHGRTISKTCRIFPEKDSPFKNDGSIQLPENAYYKDVNVCSDKKKGDYPDCQCAYKKIEYSGITKYYNYNTDDKDIPSGICTGVNGDNKIGKVCTSNSDCGDPNAGAYCASKSKQTSAMGIRGFCLEKDPRLKGKDINACLTWWPGPGIGDPDVYENYLEAGYTATGNKQWYCLDSIGGGSAPAFKNVAGLSSSNNCYYNGDCDNYYEYNVTPNNIPKDDILYIKLELGANDTGKDCKGRYNGWSHQDVYLQENVDNKDNQWHRGDWYGCIVNNGDNGGDDKKSCQNNHKLSTDCSSGSTCTKVKAIFDKNDHLSKLKFLNCDNSPGEGTSDWGNGANGVEVYLKNGCKYMVQISAGNNDIVKGAYTNRLWESDKNKYSADSSNPKPSYYSTQCKPYGVANINSSFFNDNPHKLVLINNNDNNNCLPNKANVVHNENSLKSLFAKISDKKEFNINSGSCSNPYPQKGTCENSNGTKCYDDSDCEVSSGNINIDLGSCIGAKKGGCSHNANKSCTKDSDCPFDTTNGMTYKSVGGTWDIPESLPAGHNPPKVASVDINTCDENNKCEKLNENKITIGNKDNGNIVRDNRPYPAILKFFAWADTNHMPIRNITIDWLGNGTALNSIISYDVIAKNHKAICDNSSFGDSPNACVEKYFRFNHIYSCTKKSPAWNSSFCPHKIKNACCFKPKVYIKDNWDWCNSTDTKGIFMGEKKCQSNKTAAGTAYDGVIIIKSK